MAVELLLMNLRKRLDRHGYNSHASAHEGLGIITEEYHELIQAVGSDQNHRVIDEALDVGVACLWLVATLLEKDPDQRREGLGRDPAQVS